jgi:hypothetical protein
MGVALQSSTLQLLKCNRRPQHLIHFLSFSGVFFAFVFKLVFFADTPAANHRRAERRMKCPRALL